MESPKRKSVESFLGWERRIVPSAQFYSPNPFKITSYLLWLCESGAAAWLGAQRWGYGGDRVLKRGLQLWVSSGWIPEVGRERERGVAGVFVN